MEASKASNEGI